MPLPFEDRMLMFYREINWTNLQGGNALWNDHNYVSLHWLRFGWGKVKRQGLDIVPEVNQGLSEWTSKMNDWEMKTPVFWQGVTSSHSNSCFYSTEVVKKFGRQDGLSYNFSFLISLTNPGSATCCLSSDSLKSRIYFQKFFSFNPPVLIIFYQ